MTFAIYIVLFLAFFIAGLNLLPTAGALPISGISSVNLIVGYMRAWNFIFPIDTLFVCFGIVVTFELSVWGWHAIKWVFHLLRGSQTS